MAVTGTGLGMELVLPKASPRDSRIEGNSLLACKLAHKEDGVGALFVDDEDEGTVSLEHVVTQVCRHCHLCSRC